MIVLLLALVAICCAQTQITLPYTVDRVGPSFKPNTYLFQFNVTAANLKWAQNNVTVFLQSTQDWDLSATEGSTPPNNECSNGWYNRTSGLTEFLTFPVLVGKSYFVRVCAYTTTSSYYAIKIDYLPLPVMCTRITGFLDDQLEYQKFTVTPTPFPVLVGYNFFEGSTAGAALGHQTDSIRNLAVTTPDGLYNLIYDVDLKIGFSVAPDGVSQVSVQDCGAEKRSTQVSKMIRTPLKAQHRDGLSDPVVCTFTSGVVKISYQWSSNQTNGALQGRFYSTRVVTAAGTSEGFGYIFKGGLTTFVWAEGGIPYAMIVENLGRLGRTPKVRLAYHLKSPPLPVSDAEIDIVDGNVTNWKCV